MPGQPQPDETRAHIASIAARSDAETAQLTAMMHRRCWPGGADRTQRAALGWVRRWRPSRGGAGLALCSCAHGRCAVCN
jgi:hypothetical protein